MNIGALCRGRLIAVQADATLSQVALRMRDERVGSVVITSGGETDPRIVGIITDRDIVRAQLNHTADLSRLSAGEIMTSNPLVLDECESVGEAIGRMRARGVRRAPVVSKQGRPIGLVSVDDLLTQLTTTLIDVAGILGRQGRPEQR